MKIKISINKKDAPMWIAFGVYMVVAIVFLFLHDAWREEAQTYLMCRDMGYARMMKMAVEQGESIVWMTLVYPLVHFGFPIYWQNLLSIVVTGAAVYLLLFESTFPKLARIVIAFCPMFVYFYPNISESYCLVALGLALLAWQFPRRFEKPVMYCFLLALMFHTHWEMLVFSAGCTVWFLTEIMLRLDFKKSLYGIIPVGSFALVVMENVNSGLDLALGSLDDFWINCQSLFVEIGSYDKNDTNALLVVMAVVFVANLIFRKVDTVYWGSLAVYLLAVAQIAIVEYTIAHASNHQQFVMAAALILVWLVWVNGYRMEDDTMYMNSYFGLIGIVLIISVVLDFGYYSDVFDDFKREYSYGRETARFINKNAEEDAVFVSLSEYYDRAIIPFLNHQTSFIDGYTGEEYSYMDEKNYEKFDMLSEAATERFAATIAEQKSTGKPVYVIVQFGNYLYELEDVEWVDAVKVYESAERTLYSGENFAVYKVE